MTKKAATNSALGNTHAPKLNYVHFSPQVERNAPDFAQRLERVIARTTSFVTDSVEHEGINQAVRDAHAKGYGLAQAEVKILTGVPEAYAQGVYATPGRHEAVVRFSNGSPHVGADSQLGKATGLALKIFGIEGLTLLEDERGSGTMDYANINAPIFFANSIEHYEFIQHLFLRSLPPSGLSPAQQRMGLRAFYTAFLTGMGTLPQEEWAWDELLALISFKNAKQVNLLLSTYWTMGAVRHGDYIAKVRIAPAASFAKNVERRIPDLMSAADAYRSALAEELLLRPYEFAIQVQLCTDLERMPVEDLTVEWPEALSPFVTVATLRLPKQNIISQEREEAMDALSFSPWRCREEHRPLGAIQRARKEVYRQSSLLRHQLNHQERKEPQNWVDVLDSCRNSSSAGSEMSR